MTRFKYVPFSRKHLNALQVQERIPLARAAVAKYAAYSQDNRMSMLMTCAIQDVVALENMAASFTLCKLRMSTKSTGRLKKELLQLKWSANIYEGMPTNKRSSHYRS